jgi:hypothetical protein
LFLECAGVLQPRPVDQRTASLSRNRLPTPAASGIMRRHFPRPDPKSGTCLMTRTAPQKFARWMAKHEHRDPRYGFVYHYHPRSDAHSIALCRFILEDLLEHSPVLKQQALAGRVVYGINYGHTWAQTVDFIGNKLF